MFLEQQAKGCGPPDQHFSNISIHANPLRILLADFELAGLGWGLGFCISNKLPGDADAPGPRIARL